MTGERRGLDEVREALAARSGDVIDLVVGTPCFDPPEELRAALRRAAEERTWGYSAVGGSPALREVLGRMHVPEVPPERVFVGHGSKGALLTLLGVLLRPGDEVVVPVPSYEAYRTLPDRFGARAIPVPRAAPDFPFDPDRISAAMTDRTRAIVLSSPCNPTGVVLSSGAGRALTEVARRHGARLILDLAYDRFVFDDVPSSPPNEPDVVVELHSVSKNYGVCGWRIGWIVADAPLVRDLAAFQSAHLNPPNTVTQRALESMESVPDSFFDAARRAVRNRMDALHAALSDAGWPAWRPAGGFYLLADAREAMRSVRASHDRELCVRLARETGVGLTPGSDFGAEGWVRAAAVGLDDPSRAADVAGRLRRFVGDA